MTDKRAKIMCPVCQTPMVFTNKITPPVDGLGALIYCCPRRENETGCGHIKEIIVNFSDGKQDLFIETTELINN